MTQLKTYVFPTTYTPFLNAYGPYIYNRLLTYLYHTSITSTRHPIDDFFMTTYYNQHQSGLSLTASIYKLQAVKQLSHTIPVSFAVRNFRTTAIADVEDIYCFTSLGSKDYMMPARLPVKTYTSNSITTIILQLDIHNTPITDTP